MSVGIIHPLVGCVKAFDPFCAGRRELALQDGCDLLFGNNDDGTALFNSIAPKSVGSVNIMATLSKLGNVSGNIIRKESTN